MKLGLDRVCLVGSAGKYENKVFPLREGVTRIGRDPDNDVVLLSENVSRFHAVLIPASEGFTVRDLDSANGTWLNEERVAEASCGMGDRIRFDVEAFDLVDPSSSGYDVDGLEYAASEGERVGRLTLTRGGQRREFYLEEQTTTLGSSPFNDISLKIETISRNHCKIKNEEGLYTLVDLKSLNGVFRNGDRVEDEAVLEDGDLVDLGSVQFRFDLVDVDIAAERLRVRGAQRRKVPFLKLGLFVIFIALVTLIVLRYAVFGPSPLSPVTEMEARPLWRVRLGEGEASPLAVADVNGDGIPDVVGGTRKGLAFALDGKTSRALWRREGEGSIGTEAALADLTHDGLPDVLLPCGTGGLRVLDGDGRELWSLSEKVLGGSLSASPALADLNGDGKIDGVAVTDGGTVRRFNGIRGHGLGKDGQVEGATGELAIVPAEEGQELRILVASDQGQLFLFSGSSGEVLRKLVTGAGSPLAPAVGDIDGDGRVEAVVTTVQGIIKAFDLRTGAVLWSYGGQGRCGLAVLGDLTGNGRLDVIVPCKGGKVLALRGRDGAALWVYRDEEEHGWLDASPALWDIDGDGCVDVFLASLGNRIHLIDGHRGHALLRIDCGEALSTAPVLADIDGNATLDLVIGARSGTIIAQTLNRPIHRGAVAWSAPRGDATRTGCLRGKP